MKNRLPRHLLCLQRADGKVLWKQDVPALQPEQGKAGEHGYPCSTPLADEWLADDSRLLILSHKFLYCVGAESTQGPNLP